MGKPRLFMSGIENRLPGRPQAYKMLYLAVRKPVMHPAYAARSADPRRPAWAELQEACEVDITCIISAGIER